MFAFSLYVTVAVSLATCSDIAPVEVASVHDLIVLPESKAGEGRVVSIECTVYYCEPDGSFCFVGSNGEFICIVEPRRFLKLGTRVRIVGTTGRGRVRNTLRVGSISVLGNDEIDPARPVDIDALAYGESDCAWVRVTGKIYAVSCHSGETLFYARGQERSFVIRYAERLSLEEAARFVGAFAQAQGNLAVEFVNNQHRVIVASPPEEVAILKSSSAIPVIQPPRNAHELWLDKASTGFSIEGQVTHVEGGGFFIEMDSVGTYIHKDEQLSITLGDLVTVVGDRTPADGSLYCKLIKVNSNLPLPVPPLVAASDIVLNEIESNRVRVGAAIVGHEYRNGRLHLSLVDGDVPFTAQAITTIDAAQALELDTATNVIVTGTSTFNLAAQAFDVRVPTMRDIVVTQRSGTLSASPWLIPGLATLILTCSVAGWWLVAQIRAKRRDLRKLGAELSASYEAIHDGVLVLGAERSVIHANRSLKEFFDIPAGEPVTIERLESHFRQDEHQAFVNSWFRLQHTDETCRDIRLELSETRVLNVFSAPIEPGLAAEAPGRIWVFSDITEREELQSQLVHSQRQEAVGQLAGGFAHDFNNLLTGITASLDIAMLRDAVPVRNVRKYLQVASRAADRGATLVQQLLGFSRRTPLQMNPCRVNDIATQTFALITPSMTSGISLTHDLGTDLECVLADDTQLEQVLLNICLNAADAIGETGTIQVRTTAHQKEDDAGQVGRYVCIAIADDGPGMSPEVQSRMFEPFFTTKQSKGTGLGLAMAQGIIQQHNGWIECDSRENHGTEFRIYLPATTLPTSDVPAPSASFSSLSGRRVLIIDDEDCVRDTLAQILRNHGAKVTTASDGKAGLNVLNANQFDVVMLDWKMPKMSGREVLRQIRRRHPRLPTIVCSGNVSDCVAAESGEHPDAVLQKPFGANRMASEIARVIQASRA